MNTLLKKAQRAFRYGFASKIEVAESYLNKKYVFRYNSVRGRIDMLEKENTAKGFQRVDKRLLNTLVCELNANHIELSSTVLKELLESNYSKVVNPVQEYFTQLPAYNGKNFIQELCNTVTVENSKKWNEYFTKWLVAVVANAMNDSGCQNHTCLVLCGTQGVFKTEWLNNLTPKKLSEYLYTGKINPNCTSSLTYLSEYLLINIDDQLHKLNMHDEHGLKNLITIPSIKYRKPYDTWINEYSHLASFMATVTGKEFLTDATGSRRFLPFEVLNININKAKSLNMDNVWTQAYSLYKDGYQYYFDLQEIQELNKQNQSFMINSNEETLIDKFFEVPPTREEATSYYSNAMIKEHIERLTGEILSPKKIGEALTKLGFEKWQKTSDNQTCWVYSVIKKQEVLTLS